MTAQELVDLAVGLESTVWQALVDGDQAADDAMLAEQFLGVYPTGFANRLDHIGQLADGPAIADFEILTPSVLEITDGCLLLSYEARYRRAAGRGVERMYITSLWRRHDDRWLNVFSQDTPAIDGE
ncbi:MAG: DUF4440 domain-containing protein [Acidimicrobiales bacterium]